MSEATRAHALQHAATVHAGSNNPATVLETAEAFHAFITGDNETTPAPKTPSEAAPAAPAKSAAKPAAAKKAAPVVDDAEAEEAGEEVTKEQVGESIEALLNNNLRAQAIKLFAKYGAKSLSGVKPEDYAAIKQDAYNALMNA
jgi:hypothetical protein